ncbi:hypothetical protein LH128_27371, partial [Sphingomonas sp. LH128]
AVLDWAHPNTPCLNSREDLWARELKHALYAGGLYVGSGTDIAEPPSLLAGQGRFEVSRAHNVAIWYGGFTGAAGIADRLAHWLDGGDGALRGYPASG